MSDEEEPQEQQQQQPLKPEVIQSEIETKASGVMAPTEQYPGIYRLNEAKYLTETDEYRINDIHYETEHNWIYWTTVDVTLKPKRQSYYFQFSVHMHYTVTKGTVLCVIGTRSEHLHEHDMIAVPAGRHHMMVNIREDSESSYTIQVPAKLDLREYLGVAFQEPRERKEPVKRAYQPAPAPPPYVPPVVIPGPPFPGAKVVSKKASPPPMNG